jgi:hypothetical protein
MNYLFKLFLPSNFVIKTGNWYRPTNFLPTWVLDSSYHNLESCQIDVLYLTRFINKARLSVCIVSWTQTFKAFVYQSHTYQPTLAVWVFHRVVPSLVLQTMSVICRVCRAFKAFDDLDQDRAKFIELRIFLRCDKFLVLWSRGIEPRLT